MASTQSGGTGITLGTQFTGFQTLDFASGAPWTVDAGAGASASHALSIDGFAAGDTIDITNLNLVAITADESGSTFMTTDGTFDFSGIPAGDTFVLTAANGNAGTDITVTAACFRRGTRISSARGEVAPIRFRAGALGDELPTRNLWVSPEHAMHIDRMPIPAAALVNRTSITREDVIEDLVSMHLEFDAHTIIFAEGAPSESFVDEESRRRFDNAGEYARLYPNATASPARFCAARVEDGFELEAVRRQLGIIADAMRQAAPIPAAPSAGNFKRAVRCNAARHRSA